MSDDPLRVRPDPSIAFALGSELARDDVDGARIAVSFAPSPGEEVARGVVLSIRRGPPGVATFGCYLRPSGMRAVVDLLASALVGMGEVPSDVVLDDGERWALREVLHHPMTDVRERTLYLVHKLEKAGVSLRRAQLVLAAFGLDEPEDLAKTYAPAR